MNKQEQERRAKLMRMQAERLPEIKRRFEENQSRSHFENTEEKPVETGAAVIFEQAQKRNFNSNFKPGGKDFRGKKSDRANSANGANNSNNSDNQKSRNNRQNKNNKKRGNQGNAAENNTAANDNDSRKVNLSVSTRRGEMVHH